MSDIKILNLWSTEGITVNDPGLKGYINLKASIVPRTCGRHAARQFYKSQLNIVERLVNHLYVPGHRGKKHLLSSGACVGNVSTIWGIIKDCFKILENKTKKNPVEVLVRAIENAALREEITSFQVGGIIVRRAVITAPQRRVDLALRLMTQSSYRRACGNPNGMAACLADEILACYSNDSALSTTIKEKQRIEREAAGAR